MTKQEKIREGIAGRYCYGKYGSLLSYISNGFGNQDSRVVESFKFADDDMNRLHSQGVVIKGCERLLDGYYVGSFTSPETLYEVEPLIRE